MRGLPNERKPKTTLGACAKTLQVSPKWGPDQEQKPQARHLELGLGKKEKQPHGWRSRSHTPWEPTGLELMNFASYVYRVWLPNCAKQSSCQPSSPPLYFAPPNDPKGLWVCWGHSAVKDAQLTPPSLWRLVVFAAHLFGLRWHGAGTR